VIPTSATQRYQKSFTPLNTLGEISSRYSFVLRSRSRVVLLYSPVIAHKTPNQSLEPTADRPSRQMV